MPEFKVVSAFAPAGDQPGAIAGLAEGVWPDLEAVAASRAVDRIFAPNTELKPFADIAHQQWLDAVARVTSTRR